MTSSSCTYVEAISKVPIEIWLRIALIAASDTRCLVANREQARTTPLDNSPALRYNIPSSNLTPGSAPLTPLGPVTGSVSEIGAQERTLSTDYFSVQTIRSRRRSRHEEGTLSLTAPQRDDNHNTRNSRDVELLASGTAASGAATPAISLGISQPEIDVLSGWKVSSREPAVEEAVFEPRELLSSLSRTCRHLRSLIWPYITGTLSIPLAVLQSHSFDLHKDLTDRVTSLQRYVRDLEISIAPTDDFRASKLLQLLEHLGQSLDTLLFRFHSTSNETPTGLPARYQLAYVPSGIFLPSSSPQSEPKCVLLPKLARLRIVSQGDPSGSTAAGNLPGLLAYSSELTEIDLSGAPMDMRAFMTAVEHLASHRTSLEVLHLNLRNPKLVSLDPTDPVDNHCITIALDWLLDCCGILPHLRDLSISCFGGVEIIQGTQWISFAKRIRANFPLLRNLTLPIAPVTFGHADVARQCAEAVALLTSDSSWLQDSSTALRGIPSALANLETVTLKLTSSVERLAGLLSGARGESHQTPWQRLRLTEFGEVWHGSIIRASDDFVWPKIVGRSIPFRTP